VGEGEDQRAKQASHPRKTARPCAADEITERDFKYGDQQDTMVSSENREASGEVKILWINEGD
jgi:hypothetical protein